MSGTVYLVRSDDQLIAMEESPHSSEDVFQALLADYPSLLAGEQMDTEEPRRWLLVRRETAIPDDELASGRWSVDHLFLDQDAVPTLVEVKRSTDTRLRREVVGQMLDYAANAALYWRTEDLQSDFFANCEENGLDPDHELATLLEDAEADTDLFWDQVRLNLRAGKIRLVFVADEIPIELRRIVEFLNSQMDPAEVYAVEIKRYAGQSQQVVVPRLIGEAKQAAVRTAARSRQSRQWDEQTFFEELERRTGPEVVGVGRKMLQWGINHNLRIWWGRGKIDGSCYLMLDHGDVKQWTFTFWTDGGVMLELRNMRTRPPFDDDHLRLELVDRLNRIPGVDIPPERAAGIPTIPMSTFVDDEKLNAFLDVFDWVVQVIRGQE